MPKNKHWKGLKRCARYLRTPVFQLNQAVSYLLRTDDVFHKGSFPACPGAREKYLRSYRYQLPTEILCVTEDLPH